MRGTAVRVPAGLLGDAIPGLCVLAISLVVRSLYATGSTWRELGIIALASIAAGAARRRPSWALSLIWMAAILQVLGGSIVLGVELAVLVTAYGVARHGSPPTVWLAGLSIPVGAAVAIGYAAYRPQAFADAVVVARLLRSSGLGITTGLFVVLAVPAAPFALGLLLRLDERNRRISTERDAAREQAAAEHGLAAARARQATLARDVHDIVGHSLAVIIAQADSAQLATEEAPVREALAQIAAVGRTSLAEVRDVLSRTEERPDVSVRRVEPDLRELIDGVRAAGSDVREASTGEPLALGPERAGTAYRVLQELLTNSLKHGAPGEPVHVELAWRATGLTMRVANVVNVVADDDAATTTGMGLAGARARLDAVGGTLATTRAPDGSFVAVAVLPRDLQVNP